MCVCMIPSHPFPYEIPCFRDTDSCGFILNQCLAMFFLSLPLAFSHRNDELWGSTNARDLSPELEHNDEHYTNKKHETWRK